MFKKGIAKALIIAIGIGVMFVGCGEKKPDTRKVYVDPRLDGAPSWVLIPQVPGMVAAVGSAPNNAANDIGFQRTEAMAAARDNLARILQTKVGNMFKSFKGTTGNGAAATFDKTTTNVSKQVAKQTLNGTVIKDTWVNKQSTLFVLMAVDTKNVTDAMEKQVKTSYKNDKALYQKFIAAKAQGDLKKELEAFNK